MLQRCGRGRRPAAAKELKRGTVVALLPDRGDRYLTTTLFRAVEAEALGKAA